jgi:predicted nucleotidyltransferase
MNSCIVGIVAEYNPLHNGHEYHLNRALSKSGAEGVVVVLSSSFTQRGEPALVDKWERAEMALCAGADVVLELPVVFSSHNAGPFANAAVDIMIKCGIITHISFGMESPSPKILDIISHILIQEPEPFKTHLKSLLKQGFSFVEARAKTLGHMVPGAEEFLSGSNNALAVAYNCRLKQTGSFIKTLPVKRTGTSYHDMEPNNGIASATAIRKLIKNGQFERAFDYIPSFSGKILEQCRISGRLLADKERLWPLVRIVLERLDPGDDPQYAEMGEGLLRRLKRISEGSECLEDLISRSISRRHARGRIQRGLIHTLLALDHDENRKFQAAGPQYIRVLGYSSKGQYLLKKSRKISGLPIITKSSAPFSEISRKMMDMEHRASRIWESLLDNPNMEREKKARPIVL